MTCGLGHNRVRQSTTSSLPLRASLSDDPAPSRGQAPLVGRLPPFVGHHGLVGVEGDWGMLWLRGCGSDRALVLPVLDHNDRLLGAIVIDDILEAARRSRAWSRRVRSRGWPGRAAGGHGATVVEVPAGVVDELEASVERGDHPRDPCGGSQDDRANRSPFGHLVAGDEPEAEPRRVRPEQPGRRIGVRGGQRRRPVHLRPDPLPDDGRGPGPAGALAATEAELGEAEPSGDADAGLLAGPVLGWGPPQPVISSARAAVKTMTGVAALRSRRPEGVTRAVSAACLELAENTPRGWPDQSAIQHPHQGPVFSTRPPHIRESR